MRRRAVLAAVGTLGSAATGATAGGESQARDPATRRTPDGRVATATPTEGPPVVDNAGTEDETVVVDVRVTDTEGAPLEGVLVKLEDRGGTPDDRFGQTGPSGRLRFLEGVGPPPCNTQTLRLPEYGNAAGLGCNDGGATLEHAFVVDPDATDTPRTESGGPTPQGTTASEPTPQGTPTPEPAPPDRSGSDRWLPGLARTVAWLGGVALAGPLVLGALLVALGRSDEEA